MAAPAQHDTQVPPASSRPAALRGTCMGAAVLLIIQFGLGMGVNLYITLPAHGRHPPQLAAVLSLR